MRILIAAWSFQGHINPTMAIAIALRDRGHEVAFLSGPRARSVVEAAGFAFFPFTFLDEERVYRATFSGAARHVHTRPQALREWLVDTIPDQVKDCEAAAQSWNAEVILCDITVWAPPLILAPKGAKVAMCSFAPGCMIPSPQTPPWGLGLPAPRTLSSRALCSVVRRVTDIGVAKLRRAADAVRQQFGLPPLGMPVHAWIGRNTPLYLVPSIRELDYDRNDLPGHVHYIGPIIWNKPSPEISEELDRIPSARPWVHATEGTMHFWEPFLLQATAQGLANTPVEVILASGDPEARKSLAGVAPNIHVMEWVPHKVLFARTSVVITTGGAGTILTALAAGVPLLIVPTEWDKPDNAERVVAAGAALRLSPRRCTPENLRAAVEKLLHDPRYRCQAERLGALLRQTRGPERAAELLEQTFVLSN